LKYKGLVAAPKIDWNGLREQRAAAGGFLLTRYIQSILPSESLQTFKTSQGGRGMMMMM